MDAKHTQGLLTLIGLMGESINLYGRNHTIFHCGLGLRTNNFNDEQEANARRIVACWNACTDYATEVLESANLHESAYAAEGREFELTRQRDAAAARIEWLQRANTLHRQVDILYVVDGYQVTITWDEVPISKAFHGATVAEAIDKAMAGFNFDARQRIADRPDLSPQERQISALAAQRDELLAFAQSLVDAWESPKGMPNPYQIAAAARAAIAKASGVAG